MERRQRAAELFVQAGNLLSGDGEYGQEGGKGSQEGCSTCAAQQRGTQSANNMPRITNKSSATSSSSSSLSSQRQVSTIPIGPTDLPNHQEKEAKRWTYPSPQMF